MRAGDANRRLAVSAIFHSKRLNNDEPPSASSRLVDTDFQAIGMLLLPRLLRAV